MLKAIRQFIIGEDAFLLRRHLDPLLTKLVDPSLKDFNFEKISAATVPAARMIESILTVPMMADFRTLVVDDFQSYGKDELDALIPIFKKQDVPTHIILIAAKFDKRLSFYKAFAQQGDVIELKKPYANQIPSLLLQEAKALQLSLETGVAETLIDLVGPDLFTLTSELEKLKIYVHPRERISRQDVNDIVAPGMIDNVFLLGTLLGQKNLAKANSVFKQMIEQGESPVKLVAMVIGHFRKILLTRQCLDQGARAPQLEDVLKIPGFFVKEYVEQARRFSLSEAKILYGHLMELSENLRSTGLSKMSLVENFFQQVCF